MSVPQGRIVSVDASSESSGLRVFWCGGLERWAVLQLLCIIMGKTAYLLGGEMRVEDNILVGRGDARFYGTLVEPSFMKGLSSVVHGGGHGKYSEVLIISFLNKKKEYDVSPHY